MKKKFCDLKTGDKIWFIIVDRIPKLFETYLLKNPKEVGTKRNHFLYVLNLSAPNNNSFTVGPIDGNESSFLNGYYYFTDENEAIEFRKELAKKELKKQLDIINNLQNIADELITIIDTN